MNQDRLCTLRNMRRCCGDTSTIESSPSRGLFATLLAMVGIVESITMINVSIILAAVLRSQSNVLWAESLRFENGKLNKRTTKD